MSKTFFMTMFVFTWLGLGGAAGLSAQENQPEWQWYVIDKDNQVKVNLYLFWTRGCPKCDQARIFTDYLRKSYTWINIYEYEITTDWNNLELYRKMATSLNRQAGQTPAFFYTNYLHIGYESYNLTGSYIQKQLEYTYNHLKKQMEKKKTPESSRLSGLPGLLQRQVSPVTLLALLPTTMLPVQTARTVLVQQTNVGLPNSANQPPPALPLELPDLEKMPELQPPAQEKLQVPFWGEVDTEALALPALTVIIASCDAFNPCAFFVLLSLLSLLVHANNRARMLLVGGVFVFFSGFFYFLFMSAWLNVFLLVGHLWLITAVAGVLAIAVALINIKDYFWFKRGVSLSIPESAKPDLFQRMRGLLGAASLWSVLAGTVALAVAANLYELLCTSGFPMVFTRTLTLRELPTLTYYGYLVLYNVIYVIPLALIVLAFTYTLGSRKLQEHEGRILKLLSGNMMLLLGLMLVFWPDWLHSVLAAAFTLLAAVALTAFIVLTQYIHHRFCTRTPPPGPTTEKEKSAMVS